MANALSGSDLFHPLKSKHDLSALSLFHMLKPAILVLLDKGIKVVVLTLGAKGVILCSKGGRSCIKSHIKKATQSGFGGQLYKTIMQKCPPNQHFGVLEPDRSSFLFSVHFPSLSAKVVRLTGAGDCLVGGTLTSICAGLDIMQSISVGIAVAKATVEVEANVPSAFSLATIAGKVSTFDLCIIVINTYESLMQFVLDLFWKVLGIPNHK